MAKQYIKKYSQRIGIIKGYVKVDNRQSHLDRVNRSDRRTGGKAKVYCGKFQ